MEPNADPRLAPPLAERLRAHAAPDPGDAYFAALPDRVAARVRVGGAPAAGRRAAPDRAPAHRSAPRRAAFAGAVLAVLIVLVYALPHSTPRPAGPRTAQARLPAPPSSPAATADSGDVRAPKPVPGTLKPAPVRKESAPRRSSRPEQTRRREPTTARPRGALSLAAALPQRLPDVTPPELIRTLERARIVLLTLAHTDSTDDLGVLQPLAEALAADLAAQRPALDTADPAVRSVAARLEPFLLTLAHYDETPAAMATLRTRLRDDETLFRLDVALLAAGPAVPVD